MMRKCWFPLVPLLLLAIACHDTEGPSERAASEPASDVEAIRELTRQFSTSWNSADLNGFMAGYAEDAVQMPPDEPTVVGKEAIRSRVEEFSANFTGEFSFTVEDIRVSGDLAFVRNRFNESWTPKDGGETTHDVGKGLLVFQRQTDRSWKVIVEIWNSDTPIERARPQLGGPGG